MPTTRKTLMTNNTRRLRRDSLIALCLVGLTPPPVAAQATPITPAPITSIIPRVDSILQRYMQEAHVPGLVYGIVRQGRVEHIGAMGIQELETRRPVTPPTL